MDRPTTRHRHLGPPIGYATVQFDRVAPSLADAITSAVRAIDSVGLSAVRVVDEDLLTLADIAQRIGQSRESIRRYSTGERGAGGFPPPVNPEREGTAFYWWTEVAPWMRTNIAATTVAPDPTLAVANLLLQVRELSSQVLQLPTLLTLLGDPGAGK